MCFHNWHSFLAIPSMDTSQLYDKAITWLVNAGPKVLTAVIIFFVGQWFIRLLRKLMHRSLEQKQFEPSLRPFLVNLLFTVLQVLLVIGIMQVLGIQMTVFAAVLASFGVAVGLALSGTLQNFASGLLILILKPFQVGDNIVAQGEKGTVTSIQLFYTTVTSFDNKTLIVPNSKLSNELIVNLSRSGTRRMDTVLELPYTVPFEELKKLITDTINHNQHILKDPAFRIGIAELKGETYTVMINLWLPAHGFQDEKMVFNEALLAAIVASGIKMPEP